MGQLDMQSGADVVALDAERQKRSSEGDEALSTAGGMLRAAREALGWTTLELAERTNIKEQHIVSIEEMNAEALPSQAYTMGFVRAVAREVSLPEDALMKRFREQIGYESSHRSPGIAKPVKGGNLGEGKEASAILLIVIVGLFAFVAWKLLNSAAPIPDDEADRFAFSKDDQEATVVAQGAEATAPAEVPEPTVEAFSNTRAPETVAPIEEEPAPSLVRDDREVIESELGPVVDDPATTQGDTSEAIPEEVVALRRINSVDPVYPPLCEGSAELVETVTVSFAIDGRGRPISRRIVQSSNPCFNGAALAALERWRYDSETVTEANQAQTARFTFDRPY